MPINNGCKSVAYLINSPSAVVKLASVGPTKIAIKLPETIVTTGVNKISNFVLPDTNLPTYTPITAAINAPIGSPGPANTILPSTISVPANILVAYAPTIPFSTLE